jgi:ribosomal protein S18 acetylase RimI-like enzyme
VREQADLPAPPLTLRLGGASDARFVGELGERVFGHLGDYARILPGWLGHEGVITHIAEEGERAVGLTMLGFYPAQKGRFIADLLAIAISPEAQGRGLGRKLLVHAISEVRAAQRRLRVDELRLSVAEDNARARKMFAAHGFQLVAGDTGRYDGGQTALHMLLRL